MSLFRDILIVLFCYCTVSQSHGAEEPLFTAEQNRYQHHILAIDSHGSGFYPVVERREKKGKNSYKVSRRPMRGEDTRNLDVALQGRRELHDYLTEMFTKMLQQKPKEVVIYIHGGLNDLDGAIQKAAQMTDYFDEQEPAAKIYYIGICWNSGLFPTLGEHYFRVREGLRQPMRAMISAPAMLIADVGSAISRAPLRIIDLLYNDVHTVNPRGFARQRAADTRFAELQGRAEGGVQVSEGKDERSAVGKASDATRWVLSAPIKAAVVPIIDWGGVKPWKNMLRRTRTMFERETEFIPQQARKVTGSVAERKASSLLKEQLTATGRLGAVRLFCHYASSYLAALPGRPKINLFGHSMGAIVAAEMLHRSHFEYPLPFDNVVLMAAACSVNDFKNKIVPYLADTNRARGMAPNEEKTRFFNLCLNDAAERAEKNPMDLDLTPRGSLLVWIDTLYQEPESENDRTLGRWENAILATDDIPSNVLSRTTIKAFGRNREANKTSPSYTFVQGSGKTIEEPIKHGDFGRFDAGKNTKNFAFWRPIYWNIEIDENIEVGAFTYLPNSNL